jgi:hypothetical protein
MYLGSTNSKRIRKAMKKDKAVVFKSSRALGDKSFHCFIIIESFESDLLPESSSSDLSELNLLVRLDTGVFTAKFKIYIKLLNAWQ